MIKFIMLFILMFIFMNLLWFMFIFFNDLFFISNIFFYILSILLYNFFCFYRIKSFKAIEFKEHIIFKSKVSKIVVDESFSKFLGCESVGEINESLVKIIEMCLINDKPVAWSAVYSFDGVTDCFKVCNLSRDKSLVFTNNFWKLSVKYFIKNKNVYNFNCFFKYEVKLDCNTNKYVVVSKIGEDEFFKESFYNCSTYWLLYEFYGISNCGKEMVLCYVLLNKFTNQFFILGNSPIVCEDSKISFTLASSGHKLNSED